MRELLEHATADFDLLLCDTPPIIAVADAVALSSHCDGVILVVRTGGVPHEVVKRAAGQIEAVKGRILGVLLNSVNLRRDGYYYDYYRYYHAYYGSDEQTGGHGKK
jgi:Mrp family chromosome partitioning ATPase